MYMQDDCCVDDLIYIVAASITELMTSRDVVIRHSISSVPLIPGEQAAADEEGGAEIVSNVVSIRSVYPTYSPFLPSTHFGYSRMLIQRRN